MSTDSSSLGKKAILLVNPVAGRKMIQRSLSTVVRTLMDGGYLVTVAVTAARDEARELTARFGKDYDLIACAGGDGTVNECISGMAEAELVRPLGYIPCGSTNDFALSHEIPTDIPEAAKAIIGGRQRQYDIGCFGGRYFLHHALFGAFTRLAYSTDQTQKNLLGFGAYVLDGLRELPNLKPIPMIVTADGVKEEGEYLFGAVSVNRFIAGLFTLPEESIGETDGRLAAVLIKVPKSVADWDVLGRSLLSGDPNCAMVKVMVGEQIQVETPEGLEWSLDGESSGTREEVLITAKRRFLTLQG
jgi:YegS/Rv2252/BmrU family lipid kinase